MAGVYAYVLVDFRSPTEFPHPQDQCFVEQASLFEVLNESPRGTVDVSRLRRQHLRCERVHVPAPVIDLHKADAALDETSGHECGVLKFSSLFGFLTPPLKRAVWLA